MATPSYTVISKDSVFKGTFELQDHLQIDGIFEGSIHTNQDVKVSLGGNAKTNITAENVFIEGNLEGEIIAKQSVTVGKEGRIDGNITSPNLKIEPGATTLGKVSINKKINATPNKKINNNG